MYCNIQSFAQEINPFTELEITFSVETNTIISAENSNFLKILHVNLARNTFRLFKVFVVVFFHLKVLLIEIEMTESRNDFSVHVLGCYIPQCPITEVNIFPCFRKYFISECDESLSNDF